LSDEEIDQMMKDAEMHAAEDEQLREKIDLKNQADSTVFQTEKFLSENEDKISADQKSEVEAALEPVKKALEAEDYEAMKSSLDSLNEKMQAAATEMYSQAQQTGAEGAAGAAEEPVGEKPASEVEEADFEIVDEDENNR
jgi:molecular chaperone DnaK